MAFWDNLGGGGDIEDRRGLGVFGLGGGIVAVIIVMALGYFGINIDQTLVEELLVSTGISETVDNKDQPAEFQGADSYEVFASNVLGSSNRYWRTAIDNQATYSEPRLVLFRDATRSGCGVATSEIGPHYCPTDQTIYLDETFFDVLAKQLGGSNGDVAQAYVIAHEVGHHVQNVSGTMAKVQSDPSYRQTGDNSLSVRLELQADCYAGLWAHSIKNQGVFESESEIKEALDAAAAVGDDRVQSTSGSVNPETWTHGSSQQRVDAFNRGWTSGQLSQCVL